MTRRNDRTLHPVGAGPHGYVRNGDMWTVTHTNPDGSITATRTRSAAGTAPASIRLPAAYVAHVVELGYASTTHRAQGMTVDRAHVLAHPGMTRENLYVAMTRGRHANHVYVALDGVDPECDDLPDVPTSSTGHEILGSIITTPGAEQSATAHVATAQNEAGSLHRLEPIARTLLAEASRNRWTAALTRAGVGDGVAQDLISGEAGRLFTTLDRIATLTSQPAAAVREIVDAVDPDGTVAALASEATRWLRAHAEHPQDVPATRGSHGLDPDGLALLSTIDELIDQRATALTNAVLDQHPAWLDRLGPEPRDARGRAAWLAEVTATVAHLDQQRPQHLPTGPGLPVHPSAVPESQGASIR